MRRLLPALIAAALALVFARPAPAQESAPQPTATPHPDSTPQHVTVPALPGQENREGTVTPQGGLQMDESGYAKTKFLSSEPTPTPAPAPGKQPPKAGAPPAAKAPAAPAAQGAGMAPGPAPSGKGVATGANVVRILGTVKSVEPGKSVTVTVQRTGKDVTYPLAGDAKLPADLKPGDAVRVRVRLAEGKKAADLVERLEKKN